MSQSSTVRTPDLAGEVDLVVPGDLFDVMLPLDDDQARVEFARLFGRMFPRAEAADRSLLAEGLLRWREDLWSAGIIMHALVTLPQGHEQQAGIDEQGGIDHQGGTGVAAPVHWHVLAGVVDVPVAGELDAGVVAARYFGDQLAGHAYTESYGTEMGWGVGLITTVPLSQVTPPEGAAGDGAEPSSTLPSRLGLAASISGSAHCGKGLLVAGVSVDADQVVDLASLVAAIGGWSVVRLDAIEPASGPGSEGADGDAS